MGAVDSGLVRWVELQRAKRTIVVVDLVESVRLYEDYPDEAYRRWRGYVQEVQAQILPRHGGVMTRHLGDGMLITAPSVGAAIRLAFDIQRALPKYNDNSPVDGAMFVRVGLHVDSVIVDELDIFGSAVNLTARVASLCKPGEIVCTSELRDQAVAGIDAFFEDLGLCFLKHVSQPVRAYRLHPPQTNSAMFVVTPPAETLAPPANSRLRPAVAVLPFEVEADSEDGGVAGDLLADALIARLSRGAPLRMISRLSTSALRGGRFSASEVGERLGAAFVISGRLMMRGARISVTVELSDAVNGEAIWADLLQGDLNDLVSADEQLVTQIATQVCNAVLRHELARVRRQPLPTLATYSLLLAGVTLMHRFSREDFERAKQCLSALSERVPRHAAPYAWMARWYGLRAAQGWTTDAHEERLRANDLCRRALDLEPDSPLALTVAGSVKVTLHKDLAGAQQLYRDALRIDPNEPLAELLLGTAHAFEGNGDEAVAHTERAIGLTPLDPIRFFYDSHAAGAALTAGQLDRAIRLAQRSLAQNRMHHSTLRTLAIAQSLAGLVDLARETVDRLRLVEPELTVQRFVDRSPGGATSHGQRFAQALRQAGLPD